MKASAPKPSKQGAEWARRVGVGKPFLTWGFGSGKGGRSTHQDEQINAWVAEQVEIAPSQAIAEPADAESTWQADVTVAVIGLLVLCAGMVRIVDEGRSLSVAMDRLEPQVAELAAAVNERRVGDVIELERALVARSAPEIREAVETRFGQPVDRWVGQQRRILGQEFNAIWDELEQSGALESDPLGSHERLMPSWNAYRALAPADRRNQVDARLNQLNRYRRLSIREATVDGEPCPEATGRRNSAGTSAQAIPFAVQLQPGYFTFTFWCGDTTWTQSAHIRDDNNREWQLTPTYTTPEEPTRSTRGSRSSATTRRSSTSSGTSRSGSSSQRDTRGTPSRSNSAPSGSQDDAMNELLRRANSR